MTVELTGAMQASFWLLDAVGAFTAWRPSTDAVQGHTARIKRRRGRKRFCRYYQAEQGGAALAATSRHTTDAYYTQQQHEVTHER